jgi:hypothetical protein
VVTAFLFAVVVLVAATVWVMRGVRRRQARARTRSGPGTSLEDALPVTSFDDIDQAVAARRCHCGAGMHPAGEGTRAAGDRRFRYTRLECDACEDEQLLFFDVTTIFH